jgi:hypothetical protein
MLLWQIQVIKHIHIVVLINVQEVVVVVVEAILLRSRIASMRTCFRCNLESTKTQVKVQASTQRSIIYRSRSLHSCDAGCHFISMVT